jgi:hypothetical protein
MLIYLSNKAVLSRFLRNCVRTPSSEISLSTKVRHTKLDLRVVVIIMHDLGVLEKISPLLQVPVCRHLALQAINSASPHGGENPRSEIAKLAPQLIQSLIDFPDDSVGGELAIGALCHSLIAVVIPEDQSKLRIAKTLDIQNIVRVVTDTLKRPITSTYLVNHGADILSSCTWHFPQVYHNLPPSSIAFLVAGLRSKDWQFRCGCMSGLFRLHILDAEQDPVHSDHQLYLQMVMQGFPSHINSVLIAYGHSRCETEMRAKATLNYQNVMVKAAGNHDLYSLGISLAELITRTEYSVSHGGFRDVDPKTGEHCYRDFGLPFTDWADSLPHCAKAIREKGVAKEQYLADILDAKYAIMHQRLEQALELASAAIERNPKCAYFYYVLSLGADPVSGLRAAKKGLTCQYTTPFIRYQLLRRAVTHAGDLGNTTLANAPTEEVHKWEEGMAFLTGAFEDAKTYISEASPDNDHLKEVLYWYIILFLLIRGPDAKADLSDIQVKILHLESAILLTHFACRMLSES